MVVGTPDGAPGGAPGGALSGARTIAFAGASVAVAWEGERAAEIVAFLFERVPDRGDVPPPVARYRARSRAGSGEAGFRLARDGTLLYRGASAATLAMVLLGDVCHQLAAHSREGLLFHAAALAWKGRALLLPGAVGAGKTTLAAWLAASGLGYLSDELAYVPQGADVVEAFPRPLNLKAGSRDPLRPAFDVTAHADALLSTSEANLIPAALLNPGAPPTHRAPLGALLFPQREPGAAFALRPLSKAQAGLALMRCLVNARNLPDHGFAEVARLARACPAYTLHYGDCSQLAEVALAFEDIVSLS